MPENEPSSKPVFKKLLLKPGQRAVFLNAPEEYGEVLRQIPAGVEVSKTLDGQFDFIQYFVTRKVQLDADIGRIKSAMKPATLLWITYPKSKALGTDLSRDMLREHLLSSGLVAVAMVAIDGTWAAMRLKLL